MGLPSTKRPNCFRGFSLWGLTCGLRGCKRQHSRIRAMKISSSTGLHPGDPCNRGRKQRRAGLHIERALGRGLVGNVYLGRVVRVPARHAVRLHRHRAGARGFLHVADPAGRSGGRQWPAQPQRRHAHPIERLVLRAKPAGPGHQGPHRHQGRPLVQPDQHRRPHAGAPAAGTSIIASARRGSPETRERSARVQALVGTADPRRWRRLHPAPMPRKPRRRPGRRHRLFARDLAADPRQAQRRAAQPAAPGPEPGQRVLRDRPPSAPTPSASTRRCSTRCCASSPTPSCPKVGSKLEHYRGERPIFDLCNGRHRDCPSAGARVRAEVGRLLVFDQTEAMTTIDVNTGASSAPGTFDDTIFKTNLEAPAPSPASCACATRRHRHRRLHRHGREDHRAAVLAEFRSSWPATAPGSPCRRLHPARPGRDDAQAHPRVAVAHALRALPHL